MNQSTLFKRTLLGAAIAATLGLTACGGGSSSSDEDGSSSFTSATTSGTAAKGILNKGVVTAIELGLDQTELRTLSTTMTDINGAYSLTIPSSYAGGPIKVSISSAADTEMKCDVVAGCGNRADDITDTDAVVDFGEWYKPGVDKVAMSALVASATSGSTVAVNITPFTTMATKRALESVTLDANAVSNANSEVSALLGVNILNTKPVDITDSAVDASSQEVIYAVLSAAIANSAIKDVTTGVPDINAAIEKLATDFEGGKISALVLDDIITEANKTLTEAGITDTSGVVAELEADVQAAGEGGEIDPEPTDSATVSNVDKAKVLVADFRTYANNMNLAVTNPAFGGEFRTQVEMASLVINNLESTQDPLYVLNQVMGLVESLKQDVIDSDSNVREGTVNFPEESETPVSDIPFESGSMDYDVNYNPDTGVFNGTVTFVNAVIEDKTVNLSFTESSTYIYSEESNSSSGSSQEIDNVDNNISGTIIGGNSSLTILAADFGETDRNDQWETTETTETTDGTYSDSGTYDGINTLSADIVLEFTNEGESTTLIYTGNVLVDMLQKSEWSTSYNYETEEYSDTAKNLSPVKNLTLDGSLDLGNESIVFNTTVSMPNAETFIIKDDPFTETESEWLQMSAGFGLTIDTVDLQDVDINLSANRTAYDAAHADISLSHGDRTVVLAFDMPLTPSGPLEYPDFMNLMVGDPQGTITVTDLNGTALTLTPSGNEFGDIGAVTIDGLDVATITRTEDGLIKTSYADGTFEIF